MRNDLRRDNRRTMTDTEFIEELRKWWSFDDRQQHTHSWHSREDFIEKKLPKLLDQVRFDLPPING
jgi:hypothetical protein